MNNNELLSAISEMLDRKIGPLEADVHSLKGEMSSLKGEISSFKDEMYSFKDEMYSFKKEMNDNYEAIKKEVISIKLDIENDIKPNIRKLAESYVPAAKKFESEADRIEKIEEDQELMKKVIAKHSMQFQKLPCCVLQV